MTLTRRLFAITATALLLLLGTLASLGCGDDESPATSDKEKQVAAEQGGPRGPDDVPPPALLPVADRLEGAGYRVGTLLNVPDYAEGLPIEVDDGRLSVTVYSYKTDGRLADAKSNFSTIEKETPEQVELVVRDRRIYLAVTEAPKQVDSARFRKIVEIGEAG